MDLSTLPASARRLRSAKPCIGAEGSLFTAIILPAPFIPTLCCIAPDIPNAMYSSGFTILPESPT